jgi:hypothetical protein
MGNAGIDIRRYHFIQAIVPLSSHHVYPSSRNQITIVILEAMTLLFLIIGYSLSLEF